VVIVEVGNDERSGRVERNDSGDLADDSDIDENVEADDGVIVRDIGTARTRLGIGVEKRVCARSMRLRGGIRGIFLHLSADSCIHQTEAAYVESSTLLSIGCRDRGIGVDW
jgi:hypothetical protein